MGSPLERKCTRDTIKSVVRAQVNNKTTVLLVLTISRKIARAAGQPLQADYACIPAQPTRCISMQSSCTARTPLALPSPVKPRRHKDTTKLGRATWSVNPLRSLHCSLRNATGTEHHLKVSSHFVALLGSSFGNTVYSQNSTQQNPSVRISRSNEQIRIPPHVPIRLNAFTNSN